jgi:ComF family protein
VPLGIATTGHPPGLLGRTLGALLAPSLCWGCDGHARRGEPLCASCRASLHRLAPEPVWLSFVRVWAPVGYSGAARDLVRALKFRQAAAVADAMAAQIVANAPPGWLAGATLVPVPLHPQRLRSRGFNQAALIAAAVARRGRLELLDCLTRTGAVTTQVGRHRAERRAGPAGSIEVRAGPARARGSPVPTRVLLVDDVVTTGATLAACRGSLAAAGSLEVSAVVFARTLGR